jgi:hypothetical protein
MILIPDGRTSSYKSTEGDGTFSGVPIETDFSLSIKKDESNSSPDWEFSKVNVVLLIQVQ